MATRIVVMPPSRKNVLQQSNIEEKENRQEIQLMLPKDDQYDDSDSDDWKSSSRKKSAPGYVTKADGGNSRKRHIRGSTPNQPSASSYVIARRNERERNRVRQVNESFSELRNRIPLYLYESEMDEKGKQAKKKLSKVETLRLAVQYIHRLEGLLNIKPETYDSESFEDSDVFTMEGSIKTESISDREMDVMDLSRDGKFSDEDSSDILDERKITNSCFPKGFPFDTNTNPLDTDIKNEYPSDASVLPPLPPISSTFSATLYYSDIYDNCSADDITTKVNEP